MTRRSRMAKRIHKDTIVSMAGGGSPLQISRIPRSGSSSWRELNVSRLYLYATASLKPEWELVAFNLGVSPPSLPPPPYTKCPSCMVEARLHKSRLSWLSVALSNPFMSSRSTRTPNSYSAAKCRPDLPTSFFVPNFWVGLATICQNFPPTGLLGRHAPLQADF
ncbi:hypothetical protein BDZ89DRAFT_1060675, partial [Hymenopellis radicata]